MNDNDDDDNVEITSQINGRSWLAVFVSIALLVSLLIVRIGHGWLFSKSYFNAKLYARLSSKFKRGGNSRVCGVGRTLVSKHIHT